MRRNVFLTLFTMLSLLVVPAVSVSSQDLFEDVCSDVNQSAEVCSQRQNNENPLTGSSGLFERVIGLLSFVVGVASVLMVMYGGLKYITANGDANSIQSAKNTILYAVIGLALFGLSQAIIRFVIGNL